MVKRTCSMSYLRGMLLGLAALAAGAANADDGDPPIRVARLAAVEGSVSFQPAGTQDWVVPPVNRPLTTGDQLWSDRDGRAELQMDGSLLRLSSNTAVAFVNLGDHVTQIQLSSGSLIVHVRRLSDDETFEIDTPNLAFSVLRPGVYRLTVDAAGNTTAIAVRRGQGEATGGGDAYSLYADQVELFSGTSPLQANAEPYGSDQDDFDAWSDGRDRRWDNSEAARYVSPDVIGYADLDDEGSWSATPSYGYVWFPRRVVPGWAPYHDGHWAYVAPWGYTWVDDSPWGFAPFHYGRWICEQGAWGWVPVPPRHEGMPYARPVYSPALVAWVGVGAGVAWFALGPREVYVPAYHVSRNYVTQLNISNTTVNTTVIDNVYNTTFVNNKAVNLTYMNREVPGAVTATSVQAFTSAQAVGRNRLAVDAARGAPVRMTTPVLAPNKQAVLGSGRIGAPRPPVAVLSRPVVARTAPPVSGAANHTIIRIAPPARTLAGPPRTETPSSGIGDGQSGPQHAQSALHAAAPIHAGDAPTVPRPPSPSIAESVLERQHLQEQQQLHAQQQAERERIQQQQQLEHAEIARQQALAKEQAEEAQRRQQEQQVEEQHQRQTQEMMQKQAEEQRQLEQRQQLQRQQQQRVEQPVGKPPHPENR